MVQYIEDTQAPTVDKSKRQGVAVLADATGGTLHPVSFELLGKAKELAAVTGQPVMALLLCDQAADMPQKLIERGADTVYIYEHPMFRDFCVTTYANAFEDFIQKSNPLPYSSGALSRGRSLAPPRCQPPAHRPHSRLHHARNERKYRPGADSPRFWRQYYGPHYHAAHPPSVLYRALL